MCWVYYLLHGNCADIDFEDNNSRLGESEGEDESSLKGKGVLGNIIIYN